MKTPFKTPSYTLKAQKDYRERNTDTINAKARAYYHAHKEEVLLQQQTARDKQRAEDGLPPIIRGEKQRVLEKLRSDGIISNVLPQPISG